MFAHGLGRVGCRQQGRALGRAGGIDLSSEMVRGAVLGGGLALPAAGVAAALSSLFEQALMPKTVAERPASRKCLRFMV